MSAFKGFKNTLNHVFNAISNIGVKEHSFENEGKTATVRTRNLGIASSFKVTYNDNAGSSGESYEFHLFRNVTDKGVQKAKHFCKITG